MNLNDCSPCSIPKEKSLLFDLQELEWISLETLEKMKEMSFFSSAGEEDEHIY